MAIFDPSQQIAQLGREAAQGVQGSIESLSNIVGARLQAGIAQEKYKLSLYDNLISEIDAKSDELSEVNKEYTSQVIEGQKKRIFDQIQAQIKEGGDITRESIEGLERGAQEIARAVNISNAITKSYKKNGETLTKLATKGIVTTPALLGTLEEMEKRIMDPATYRKDPEEVSREIQRLVADAVNVPAATMELYKDQGTKEMSYEVGNRDVFISGPQGLMGQDGKLDLQKLKADVRSVMESIPGAVVTDELVNQYALRVVMNFDTKSSTKTNTARVREERIASEDQPTDASTFKEDFLSGNVQKFNKAASVLEGDNSILQARIVTSKNYWKDPENLALAEQELGRKIGPKENLAVIEYSNGKQQIVDLNEPGASDFIDRMIRDLKLEDDVSSYEPFKGRYLSPLPGVVGEDTRKKYQGAIEKYKNEYY